MSHNPYIYCFLYLLLIITVYQYLTNIVIFYIYLYLLFFSIFVGQIVGQIFKNSIMKTTTTTQYALDKRRKRKDGTYPIKLRVTNNRDDRRYATGLNATQEEFDKIFSPRPRGDYKDIRLKLDEQENRAREIINNLHPFTFEVFKDTFFKHEKTTNNEVFALFDKYIQGLEEQDRIGNANSYRNAKNSIHSFTRKKSLPFHSVTPLFLQKYEDWMVRSGKSLTTVGIYLRSLRRIINLAQKEGLADPTNYPFGTDKYEIPSPGNTKKAIELQDIKKLYEYPLPENSSRAYLRDLWFFSYFCNGINMKDIALLRYSNLDKDTITFRRQKTRRKNRNSKPIIISVTEPVQKIIDRWGNIPESYDTFIFDILEGNPAEKEIKSKVNNMVKRVNKAMQWLASEAGVDEHISTYTARHSCATVLKQSGASIEYISEALGHSDVRTTENYLSSFNEDTRKEMAKRLSNF
ncbi:MAG: site-specific integrase [Bacteroidia bacterium]|nr:site-specific integrase [Bacteroidia bacterium]